MDLYRSTSTRLAGTTDDLALAVRALADKDAIRALGVLYSVAVDDHDLDDAAHMEDVPLLAGEGVSSCRRARRSRWRRAAQVCAER